MEIIDCKSLMIGDWVFNEIPCYVTAIYHNGTIDCQGDNQSISTDSVDPIPLTAEILEKNGFNKPKVEDSTDWSYYKTDKTGKGMYCIFYSVDDDMFLEIASYKSYIGEYHRMGVRYVHELQHALRLAGIDKEITI